MDTPLLILASIVAIICATVSFCSWQKEKTERKVEQLDFERNLPENNCNHQMEIVYNTHTDYVEHQDCVLQTCKLCGKTTKTYV